MRLLYLLIPMLTFPVESQEHLDPFDERRVKIQKGPVKQVYDDAHKICKDRWFEPDLRTYCGPKYYHEQFDLAELKYVGLLENKDGMWPIIYDGNGSISRLSLGSKVGKQLGVVKTITDDYIVILEISPNPDVGSYKRCNYILRDGVDKGKYNLPELP